MKRLRNLKGFTLIELIVVILILGILAAIAVVGYSSITTKANATALQANATQIAKAISVDATLAESATASSFLTTDVLLIDANKDATMDYTSTADYLTKSFPGITVSYAADVVSVKSSAAADAKVRTISTGTSAIAQVVAP